MSIFKIDRKNRQKLQIILAEKKRNKSTFKIFPFEVELSNSQDPDLPERDLDEAGRKKALHGLYDCRDSNNNSALSEAAAGGCGDVVRFVMSESYDFEMLSLFGFKESQLLNCNVVM